MSKSGNKKLRALKQLSRWFVRQKRILPWRSQPTLYRVWISEIMLQQTQVATVIPYFDRFIRRFRGVKELARAQEQDVLKMWEGLGYYSRARNLHKGAKRIAAAGKFPKTKDEWLEVEGVGPYTAGAIMSIALNEPEPILDGNVERVLSRVYRIEGVDRKRILWEKSSEWVQDAYRSKIPPQDFNQAMMELGAMVCKPRSPICEECPLSDICEAKIHGEVGEYPLKVKRKKWTHVEESKVCIINSKGQVLLEKAEKGQWRSGLWDFPESGLKGLQKLKSLGEIETKNVVTTHKIRRKTKVYFGNPRVSASANRAWVNLARPNKPVGAAFNRVRRELDKKLSRGLKI